MKCLTCGTELTTGDMSAWECSGCKEKREQQTQPSHLQGWECPRCHAIHGPFVSTCGCPPPSWTSTTVTEISSINYTN